MAQVLPPPKQHATALSPMQTPERSRPRLPPTTVVIPQPEAGVRNGHLSLDVFSPVNQNGSFEFDRVLKSGEVHKRTRKTKVRRWWPKTATSQILIYETSSNGSDSTSSSAPTSCPFIRTAPKIASRSKLTSPT